MKTEKGGLFVGNNLTQGIPHSRDWDDDGGARKPQPGHRTNDPHMPEEVEKARRKQAAAAKETRRAAQVADSHLDDQHCVGSSNDVYIHHAIPAFPYSTSMG
jgi:hypothetical protein